MLDRVSKGVFHALAGSESIKRLASRYGMRQPDSFARRFVAGETVEEAIAAAQRLEAAGMMQTLDYLGESVATTAAADAATRAYLGVIEQIVRSGIGRNISLKLTQLGLTIDRATCVDNLRRILDLAANNEFFVRIDMEDSPFTEVTLDIFETMWQQGYRNTGVVLQSYLPRSLNDAGRMNRLGARVRLVKGAYKEPRGVAYQGKAEVDAAFVDIARLLLSEGNYPAIATHDPAMIEATRAFATERGIGQDRYEFQMLYGVRRDLQTQLTRDGFRMRVYVPFGREWFPYFMRRLGERPANVAFVIRSVLQER
ncbi:MAG: proline dehydrogenase family protein [Acidobacteria bacterium]|nr:proline dehydrogenase family protein [Acidobacteriota bacterium]MCA1651324.1 proline dehydrogenase family protein [Acidobacteriota bacterium]